MNEKPSKKRGWKYYLLRTVGQILVFFVLMTGVEKLYYFLEEKTAEVLETQEIESELVDEYVE